MGKSDQNNNIDIGQLYKDWIEPIDAIRSYTNINSGQSIGLTNGSEKDIIDFAKLTKIETTVQESRCHAFYRWIGLPVVSSESFIYSPGFDIHKCATRQIRNKDKLLIAKYPLKNFNSLSDSRESFVKENLKIFSNPKSIAAATLSISSGGTQKLREFSASFKNSDPLDMVITNQTYTVNTTSLVGKNPVELGLYKDSGGNQLSTDEANNLHSRRHIIKPLIVDARIELTIAPQARLVAVPFVPDDSHLKASSTENVRRPLIEKIIRDRQPLNNPAADAGTYVNKIKAFISSSPTLTDNELVKNIQSHTDIYKQTEQAQFIEAIKLITAMMDELWNAEKIIHNAQSFYYWVPEPSSTGPENGVNVRDVFLPTYIDTENTHTLATDKDLAILDSVLKDATNKINIDAANITGSPKLNFGISAESSINLSSTTASGTGDNNAQNLETLQSQRTRLLTQAGNALQTVEIIMGEFSGLGLCDIIAITSALKILPMENLLGLIDNDAYDRMLISLSLKDNNPAPTRANFTNSMMVFTDLVKDFYNLMDSIYKETKSGAP